MIPGSIDNIAQHLILLAFDSVSIQYCSTFADAFEQEAALFVGFTKKNLQIPTTMFLA